VKLMPYAFETDLVLCPLGDGKDFVVYQDFVVRIGEQKIVVKKGFITDLASIPRPFWWILDRWGKYGFAAVVHDYLYWMQASDFPKERADKLFHRLMLMSGVGTKTAGIIYWAVKTFGGKAWVANSKQNKDTGFCKFLDGQVLRPVWIKS
jgi:hypothetical protein